MANDDRCPECGSSYSLVGRVHRCIPKPKKAESTKSIASPLPHRVEPKADGGFDRARYQREYMRSYLPAWRAKRKQTVNGSST